MSRRSRKARATTCPCGSGAAFTACCGPLHAGTAKAATAETLMRSRYSAFALGDEAHLLRTWHPATRPDRLDLDGDRTWTGLEILETTGGSPLHTQGTVRFRASYTDGDGPGAQTEDSAFERVGADWYYVDALDFA
ncbi:YchJ family protein [Glycomyces sp. TRM65418]|uniref:YchJ family protein n=1 Tax=Glycomyces sp. TRM65418 TaxID=2867006 RepID=UPI001CE53894|nr:YchJ family protein [Glycomyces sp. TRM65418]MCC3765360.1 YchJ family protein [Glycomyces sp. TRM65418]QZD54977.1 YchJ family protein [Glycomyces sp. TRM65418]